MNDFTVASLKASGADAVKVLLYYSPFSSADVNAFKQTWVASVGVECRDADVPFFLEIVSYHDEMDEKSLEFARIKPDVVIRIDRRVLQRKVRRGCIESRRAGEHEFRRIRQFAAFANGLFAFRSDRSLQTSI